MARISFLGLILITAVAALAGADILVSEVGHGEVTTKYGPGSPLGWSLVGGRVSS